MFRAQLGVDMSNYAATVELARERRDLVKAEKDILEGSFRIDQQHLLIERLVEQEHDTVQANVLLKNLQQVLDSWYDHRVLIMARIDLLEKSA